MKKRGFVQNFHDDSLEADGIKYDLQTILSQSMASKEEKRREYREGTQTTKWDPERENYNDWRFLVDMWMKACDRAKLPRADRGYALFRRQKDIKKDNVGNKLVTAAQLGTIDIFSDDAVK